MKILKQNQYNQGIGKYKLLSSTSGVGSIITTKLGSYVLISDINKWRFIKWANAKLENIRANNSDDKVVYHLSEKEISNRGLIFINDLRFVQFIRSEKSIEKLVCLIGIPHMSLNESFNTPNWKRHPIRAALEKSGEECDGVSDHYMITGSHFPKWFKNSKGELKQLSEWFKMWEKECHAHSSELKFEYFAPPRDAGNFLREVVSKNENGMPIKIREYKILEQTNLILICPNGHLSDIPWQNYLKWKTEKYLRIRSENDKGETLMSSESCCGNPKLKWTESKTKSEGYASIYIECLSCGLGSGNNIEKPKINLEGINGLQPNCIGQKPWEWDFQSADIPSDYCYERADESRAKEKMRVSLVTANNVYYANGFSSLYIPLHLAENKSQELIESLDLIEKKYKKYFERISISRIDFWESKFNLEDFLIENDFYIENFSDFENKLKLEFTSENIDTIKVDRHEEYRWQEYNCFSNHSNIVEEGLVFKDILLQDELKAFFYKIQQVQSLKITNVQLDFTRVKPKERIVKIEEGKREIQESTIGKSIFSIDSKDLFVLPANETLGEGLFFQFSDVVIEKWLHENNALLEERFYKFFKYEPNENSQGIGTKRKIYNNGIKHFLIHSFSHLMMRELEFTCGYPTSSLKERLYISNSEEKSMSGVLIFTAEGAEGSMGGLVSQGDPEKIYEIIIKGLERSMNCSSDPLCWESEGQGIFDLNLAACFSCSLVAETACEENNLGLDRRVLVDDDFGYFKKILF